MGMQMVRKNKLKLGATLALLMWQGFRSRQAKRRNRPSKKEPHQKRTEPRRDMKVLYEAIFQKTNRSWSGVIRLVTVCCLRTLLNDRIAYVQGFLFQAAFGKNQSAFIRFLAEDVFLNIGFSVLKAFIDSSVRCIGRQWWTSLNRYCF